MLFVILDNDLKYYKKKYIESLRMIGPNAILVKKQYHVKYNNIILILTTELEL